jgi:YHS domain-containing protein
MRYKSLMIAASLGLALSAALPGTAIAKTAPVYTGVFSSVAVSGYDPVAYFTAGKPVEGSESFKLNYNGAEWRFSSAVNLATFKKNPARYAPQYGGYCAWAVSQGYTASADPKVWKVFNNKLYLNYNQDVGQKWSANIPGFIKSADSNWPVILKK